MNKYHSSQVKHKYQTKLARCERRIKNLQRLISLPEVKDNDRPHDRKVRRAVVKAKTDLQTLQQRSLYWSTELEKFKC